MEANKYHKILNRLKSFDYLGEKQLEDGTLLIAKALHIAPMAWLHRIYPPLTNEQIKMLEGQLKLEIPNSYKAFLRVTNGLSVFNCFSLYGLRKNYSRTIDDVWQPFDIITPNTVERPKNAKRSIFYIGGYSSEDGAWLYLNSEDDSVHLCERWKTKSLYKWESVDEMLESEISRLIALFNKNGEPLYPDKDILPISN